MKGLDSHRAGNLAMGITNSERQWLARVLRIVNRRADGGSTPNVEQARSSELIFELGDVRITPYIAQFAGTSYQIASIGGVRIVAAKKVNRLWIGVFMLGLGFLFIAFARSSGSAEPADANFPLAVAAAVVMLASVLLQFLWPAQVFKLLLRIQGAETEALSSIKAKFVADVKQAVETAFIAHAHRNREKTSA
jgi:hypothetical protein